MRLLRGKWGAVREGRGVANKGAIVAGSQALGRSRGGLSTKAVRRRYASAATTGGKRSAARRPATNATPTTTAVVVVVVALVLRLNAGFVS